MPKPLRLGELELEILEYLWGHGEASAKIVHEQGLRQNSLNTIQSTLERLYKKGLLDRRKVAHSFLYQPSVSRTEVLTRKIDDLVAELAKGETKAVLAAFVEFSSRLDDATLGELEAMIAARRQGAGGNTGEAP